MMHRRGRIRPSLFPWYLGVPGALALVAVPPAAQAGTVQAEQKISNLAGGFGGHIDPADFFGRSVAALGDPDGDGTGDLAVGTFGDDDGGNEQGAAWILFLNPDGTVASEQKISATQGGFGGALDAGDYFGYSVAALGDLDGDGIGDLAVSAVLDDDGGFNLGALWILFLNSDGTVAAEQKISETQGGFGGSLDAFDFFGSAVATLGDLDGNGTSDLAVGASGDDYLGGGALGSVWILLLNPDGTVASEQKIAEAAGGFGGDLDPQDLFGDSLAALGDLDGDGVGDLAVGAWGDEDGGQDQGALWILFLNSDGTVASEQKISETQGGFAGGLDPQDHFGVSISALGDLDGDGIGDLAVGASWDDDGGLGSHDQGAVWILFLNPDGTVASEQKISETQGSFGGDLDNFDYFGGSVAALGDLDGDGIGELAVGAYGDDGGGEQGAVWILFLAGCVELDFETEDDFATPLVNGQHLDTEFGLLVSVTSSGQNAGLGIFDSTVGGPNDPSQDRDLLVGTRNVLILQTENYPPDGSDVFPRPNDDDDGGTIAFAFTVAVEAKSLRLIDVDAGDGPTRVVLSDASARRRTYTVPSNWTGDLLLGQPGQGTLDLTTLAAQPGFGSFASANEDPLFAPAEVLRIEVQLDGSGALDDLVVCPSRRWLASARLRGGSGVNPMILRTVSLPELGGTWAANLDCSGTGSGLAVLEIRRSATSGTITPIGELLVDGALVQRMSRAYSTSPSLFTLSIPHDVALCGLELHVQGLCRGSVTTGRKTRSVRMVLTNAVDLVLGF